MGSFAAIVSCVGSLSPPFPLFLANTYDPDTFEMLGVRTGVGDLTEARAYEINVLDDQGQYATVPGGQPAWNEARWDGGTAYADNGSGVLLDPLPALVYAPRATNYFLNSQTPISQTISGRSGAHTVWLEGAGSVAVSGGLTGTVTDGSPLTGDPGGSDVILTVTGTPDFVQVEDNDAPTLPVYTEGSPVTRDACALSYDSANHDDTEGTYLIDVDLSGDSNILDGFLSVVNGLATLTDGVNTVVAPVIYPSKLGLVYGSEGIRLNADGVWSASAPYDGTLLSGALDLFRAAPVVQKAGELSRYAAQYQSVVEAAMPAPPEYAWGLGIIVKIENAGESFTIPCADTGVYGATIDWGDGNTSIPIVAWDSPALEHVYAEPGIYLVAVTGDLPQLYFNNSGDKDKVISATLFDSGAESYVNSFYGCDLVSISGKPNSSSVTDLSTCFRYNQLTALPAGLFDNTPNVTSFYACFHNNQITAIPAGLFNNAVNAANFLHCFQSNKLTAIPTGLFNNTASAANFGACFHTNQLTAIPTGLFDNTPNVTSFYACFQANQITSIPDGLFDYTSNVTNFGFCFCHNQITSIPGGLFDNTLNVTNFNSCFYNNAALSDVPANLFDNCTIVTNYAECFTGCNLTEQSTNNVLISLDTAGASNGTIDITGAQPTGSGLAAKTSLEGKGWAVTVTTP